MLSNGDIADMNCNARSCLNGEWVLCLAMLPPHLMQGAIVALRGISEALAVGGCGDDRHVPEFAVVMVAQDSPPLHLWQFSPAV